MHSIQKIQGPASPELGQKHLKKNKNIRAHQCMNVPQRTTA